MNNGLDAKSNIAYLASLQTLYEEAAKENTRLAYKYNNRARLALL